MTDIFPQGTSLVIGEAANVAALYALIPDSVLEDDGNYNFPCKSNLPDISFYFGGQAFSMTESFNYGPVFEGSTMCVGGIRARENVEWWTVGVTFMTNYYTIFDVGEVRVGFADLE